MREEASGISVRAQSRSYSMAQINALLRFLSTSENQIFGTGPVQLYFEWRVWTLRHNSQCKMIAVALIGQGKFADAQYTDVLKLMERVLGLEHPDMLNYATKFAMALWHQNRMGEAKEIARQLEERARKVLGPDNLCTRRYAKLVQDLEAKK